MIYPSLLINIDVQIEKCHYTASLEYLVGIFCEDNIIMDSSNNIFKSVNMIKIWIKQFKSSEISPPKKEKINPDLLEKILKESIF